MNVLLSIVLLIQYSICVILYTHSTLLKHLKALYNSRCSYFTVQALGKPCFLLALKVTPSCVTKLDTSEMEEVELLFE